MQNQTDSLIYLYGIVGADAPEPPDTLVGLEDGSVELVRSGGVAAVVSRVPEQLYGDEPLNARLADLAWVGERGVAHERVLDWFTERCAVIPLSLFSLHRGLARVEERLRADEAAFLRRLEALGGRREWGVKLWRQEEQVAVGVDRMSPSLSALSAEIDAAPPGRRFLLERKRDGMRMEEVRVVSRRTAHELFATLAAAAESSRNLPLSPATPGGERTLLLHAAFLVANADFDAFRGTINDQAARLSDSGFEIEFTGPWPPYHFVDSAPERARAATS